MFFKTIQGTINTENNEINLSFRLFFIVLMWLTVRNCPYKSERKLVRNCELFNLNCFFKLLLLVPSSW